MSFALFCQAPHQGFGRRAIESSELSIRSPFLDNDLARLAYRAPLGRQAGTAACVSVIEHHKPRLLAIPTDRGYLGRGNALTRAVRRGHRELLFKSEYLAGHGMPHTLAAALSILPGRLPERRLLGYHKFQHFRQWLRSELWAYVRDVLAEPVPEVEVFADRSHLSLMLEDHKAGRSNHFSALDKALTLTITAKKLFASGLSSGGARPHDHRPCPCGRDFTEDCRRSREESHVQRRRQPLKWVGILIRDVSGFGSFVHEIIAVGVDMND